jgi:CRP-like cAMP-binding protein
MMDVTGAMSPRLAQGLKASRLFGSLDAALVERLAGVAHRRTLSRGERLWSAGDKASHFFVIASGLMKIVRAGQDGDILAILGPRESIGDVAVQMRGSYPADAVAATDSVQVIGVRADVVLSLGDDPAVAKALRNALLVHTQVLQEKIEILSAGSVSRRLAALFHQLADRFGDECEDGSVTVPVALSRGELAHIVSATVETTIRIVSAWQKAGLLVTTQNGFMLYGDLASVEHDETFLRERPDRHSKADDEGAPASERCRTGRRPPAPRSAT